MRVMQGPARGTGVLSRALQLITPQVVVGSGASVTSAGAIRDLVGGRGPGILSCFPWGRGTEAPPSGACPMAAVSLPKATFAGDHGADVSDSDQSLFRASRGRGRQSPRRPPQKGLRHWGMGFESVLGYEGLSPSLRPTREAGRPGQLCAAAVMWSLVVRHGRVLWGPPSGGQWDGGNTCRSSRTEPWCAWVRAFPQAPLPRAGSSQMTQKHGPRVP